MFAAGREITTENDKSIEASSQGSFLLTRFSLLRNELNINILGVCNLITICLSNVHIQIFKREKSHLKSQ